MVRIDHATLERKIKTCAGGVAVTLGDWKFMSNWDSEIFGELPAHLICERSIIEYEGKEPCDIGLFWLPDNREHVDLIGHMLLTENVKLIVCSPRQGFFQSIEDALLRELSIPGEFSDGALAIAECLSGFEWMVLSDGNEMDSPYYLFEHGIS